MLSLALVPPGTQREEEAIPTTTITCGSLQLFFHGPPTSGQDGRCREFSPRVSWCHSSRQRWTRLSSRTPRRPWTPATNKANIKCRQKTTFLSYDLWLRFNLWLTDPDPRGPKTYGSGFGYGSGTLLQRDKSRHRSSLVRVRHERLSWSEGWVDQVLTPAC